jgi:two-component system, OmpR family, phosphate regulon sensor histidine kinase PhoR
VFHSIRWRIAIPYVILITIIMLASGIYLSSFMRQTYKNELKSELLAEARLVADNLITPLQTSNPTSEQINSLASHWSKLLNRRVTIIAANGTVLGDSSEDPAEMENHLNRPEIKQALSQGEGDSSRYSQTVGYDMMYAAVRVQYDGKTLGFARIAVPLRQVDAYITQLQSALVGIAAGTLLLVILLATWIASRTTRPLRDLTKAADQISKGDLESHLIPETPDEVGQLTQAFNLMAEKLNEQINVLETERSKMAAVLQQMTDGVIIVNDDGMIQLFNPAAENLFAVSSKEAMGHSLVEVLRNHQVVDLWQSCLETEETQVTTLEISTKRLYLQIVATPLGQALPGSTLLLFQNLTRVRQLETIRRDFISNISHELRTPLASLKALTETLQEGALDDPPAAHRFLQRMETEVDSLSLMVSELLELSRIESGRVPLQLTPSRPLEIISDAVDRLRLQAERAGLEMQIECPNDLPAVLADPNRLEQVLVNLLHNAIKFTPSGGEILISANPLDGQIVFSVKDTGVGIPSIDLPRIFERFYKADRARSTGGTGLGLAISRHLVEAHGGRIWAESLEGQGSTFSFSIPQA